MSKALLAAPWRFGFLQPLLGLCLVLVATLGHAQEDPPGRVGRVADINGAVSWWDSETNQWGAAERNLPLTSGDRISTAASGRAELRVGATVLLLSNNTELEVLRLDDTRLSFQLHSGSVALRVRSRETAIETELITAEARLLPQRAGLYRVDRDDDTTQAGSWRGELRLGDAEGLPIGAGQWVELVRDGRRGSGALRQTWGVMPRDGFAEWVSSTDRREERVAANPYVSPEMTGAEDLDRNGRWEQHPEFGALWVPTTVVADWAPYRYGRWAWVSPWGWTWVDDAPWGFAPFHYGRWVSWNGRWGWVPGAYVQRPVYAPALVAWLGGGGFGVTVRIGGPTVGWVPLAPREVYRPPYRSSTIYVERVNPTPTYRWKHPPGQVPVGPVTYHNQASPHGVTVVSGDVLMRRLPVARGLVEWPRQRDPRATVETAPPPRPNFGPGQAVGTPATPWRRADPDPERPPRRDGGDAPPQPQPAAAVPVRPTPEPWVRPALPNRRDDRREDRRDESAAAPRDPPRDSGREGPRDASRDAPRDGPRDAPRDAPRDRARDGFRDVPRDAPGEGPRDPTDGRRQRGPSSLPKDTTNWPRKPSATPTAPAVAPSTNVPVRPAPPPTVVPAAPPAVPAAKPPAPPPPPPAAAKPPPPTRERAVERDDERKRRPETQPASRDRDNQR